MDFKYTTIKQLRDEGLTDSAASNSRVRELIKLSSSFINKVTEQWFNPLVEVKKLSGRNESIIHLPSFIPILKVNSLHYVWDGTRTLITTDSYKIFERYIRAIPSILATCEDGIHERSGIFIDSAAEFEKGAQNFELDGAFGWLEDKKYVTGTTTTQIQITSEEVTMTDAVLEFDVGDFIIITKDSYSYKTIINEIEYGTNKLKFDKAEDIKMTIDAGATVTTYGRVPLLITRACNQLVISSAPKMTSAEFQSSEIQSRIKSEKTDNYSYTLFEAGEDEGGASFSGSKQIDDILENFRPPIYPVFP